MTPSTQITNMEIFAFIVVLVLELLSRKILFINRKHNRNCLKISYFLRKLQISRGNHCKIIIVGMWNFQDTFKTRKRSFISAFSICMTVPLIRWFSFSTYLYTFVSTISYINKVYPQFLTTQIFSLWKRTLFQEIY